MCALGRLFGWSWKSNPGLEVSSARSITILPFHRRWRGNSLIGTVVTTRYNNRTRGRLVMELHPSRESVMRRAVQCYRTVLSMLMERGNRGDSFPTCIQMYNVAVPSVTRRVRHTPDADLMVDNFGMFSPNDCSLRNNWKAMEIGPFLSSRGSSLMSTYSFGAPL